MSATHTFWVASDEEYAARLGGVIRAARYFREMSRESVAAACGVNPETVARWERGTVAVPAHVLHRLVDVLGVPADVLLDPPATRSDALVRIAAYDAVRASRVEPAP